MNQEEEKVARVYNFSAGPAVLPEEVLREAERQDRRNIFRSTLKGRKEGQKTE